MGKYGISVKSWWGACGCLVYFSPLLFCMFKIVHNLQSENLYYLLTAFYVPDSSAGYWISIMSKFHNNSARTIKPSSFKHGRTEAQGHPVGREQSLTLNLVCLMPDTHNISSLWVQSPAESRNSLHSLCQDVHSSLSGRIRWVGSIPSTVSISSLSWAKLIP